MGETQPSRSPKGESVVSGSLSRLLNSSHRLGARELCDAQGSIRGLAPGEYNLTCHRTSPGFPAGAGPMLKNKGFT